MSVRIFAGDCACCGQYREATAEEAAYEDELQHLIDAARVLGRSTSEVAHDLREWWRWHRVKEAAALDKDIVKL